MARSRLDKTLQKQTRRNFFFILTGGILLLALAAIFGTKLLVNFSLLVEKRTEAISSDLSDNTFVPIPQLDPFSDATNSAVITLTGTAVEGKKVVLFQNGKKSKEADIKSSGSFKFSRVELTDGENTFKIKAVVENGKESKFSEPLTIVYRDDPPDLSLDFPSDGQSFNKDSNPLRVRGKTSENVKVTVNDFWAIVDDEGNFYYNLPLKSGDNHIKIVATDEAGNKTEKEVKVTYSE